LKLDRRLPNAVHLSTGLPPKAANWWKDGRLGFLRNDLIVKTRLMPGKLAWGLSNWKLCGSLQSDGSKFKRDVTFFQKRTACELYKSLNRRRCDESKSTNRDDLGQGKLLCERIEWVFAELM